MWNAHRMKSLALETRPRVEWERLAAAMRPVGDALIGGQLLEPRSGRTFEDIGPIDGRVLARVARCGPEDVDLIGFTGSTEVGKLMRRYAGESNLKRGALACAGKSPQLVVPDTALAAAAEGIARGIVRHPLWRIQTVGLGRDRSPPRAREVLRP